MEAIGEEGSVDLSRTRPLAEVRQAYTFFEDGDVVFAKVTPCFENGKGALLEGLMAGLGFGTTELTVLRPGQKVDARFLHYFVQSPLFRGPGAGAMTGAGGLKRVPEDFTRNTKLALPPLIAQRTIADFLDRETARIDALIAKKTRFIELLREKRQALITQAVTQGLDPSVPMKDSGVAWLGRVPEHWRIKALKWLAEVGNGSTPSREEPAYWVDGTFPWLTSSVVNREEVEHAEEYITERAMRECHLPIVTPPAVLVGLTGQGRTRGMASTLRCTATISQHVAAVKPLNSEMNLIYLRRYFDMAYPQIRRDSDGAGSTKGAVTCEQLKDLPLPVPPLHEQAEIIGWIDENGHRTAQLTDQTSRSIKLLRERRAALITAAVTGQIDVREAA